ncbi:Fe-containing alcohol dehydrogenase [Pseudozyma hubeiensis]|nr:Fe-containing alcohol dehydrogenase [Pseudozyma hubeiensis]
MNRLTYLLLIVTAAEAVPRAYGGWNPQQPPYYTVDSICQPFGMNERRACFTTDVDVSQPKAGSHFNGFLSEDGKQFVIYADTQPDSLLILDDFTIKVTYPDDKKLETRYCAQAGVATNDGQLVDSTLFCIDSTYWLHIPKPAK